MFDTVTKNQMQKHDIVGMTVQELYNEYSRLNDALDIFTTNQMKKHNIITRLNDALDQSTVFFQISTEDSRG